MSCWRMASNDVSGRPAASNEFRARSCLEQGLVDELAELGADRVGAGRDQLGEERHRQLLGRVNPERGAGQAAPRQLAWRADDLAGDRVEDDREAEAETDAAERRFRGQRPAELL